MGTRKALHFNGRGLDRKHSLLAPDLPVAATAVVGQMALQTILDGSFQRGMGQVLRVKIVPLSSSRNEDREVAAVGQVYPVAFGLGVCWPPASIMLDFYSDAPVGHKRKAPGGG